MFLKESYLTNDVKLLIEAGSHIDRRVPRIFVRDGHDDGGTEGPERGAEARSAGAPRGVVCGEGRHSPSTCSMGVWGLCRQKIFEKSTLKLHIFLWF